MYSVQKYRSTSVLGCGTNGRARYGRIDTYGDDTYLWPALIISSIIIIIIIIIEMVLVPQRLGC
jgi:hypothetical protein